MLNEGREINMTAVIYARYSSDSQREESIEGQLRECTAFAEKNDITILRHYIDRAFSAKTDNRPEFQNMIKDSGKKLFDMIIVKWHRCQGIFLDSLRFFLGAGWEAGSVFIAAHKSTCPLCHP